MRATYIGNLDEWMNGFRYSRSITVRFSETDLFGHMNNTVSFTYFEEARTSYLAHLGFMREWMNEDFEGMVVTADLQCDYVKQVLFGETLNVYVKVAKVGTSSVDLHYYAANEQGECCFVGRGMMVQISKKTGKSMAWLPHWREKLIQEQMQTS